MMKKHNSYVLVLSFFLSSNSRHISHSCFFFVELGTCKWNVAIKIIFSSNISGFFLVLCYSAEIEGAVFYANTFYFDHKKKFQNYNKVHWTLQSITDAKSSRNCFYVKAFFRKFRFQVMKWLISAYFNFNDYIFMSNIMMSLNFQMPNRS